MLKIRSKEQQLSSLLFTISKEMCLRRVREWALGALETQRAGLKKERDRTDQLERQRQQDSALQGKQQEKYKMINAAMDKDIKWVLDDRHSELKRLQKRAEYASVQLHVGYSLNSLPSKTRLHPKTWRLNDFDDAGLPISTTGASQVSESYPVSLFFHSSPKNLCIYTLMHLREMVILTGALHIFDLYYSQQ